jgi:hypothetical protein
VAPVLAPERAERGERLPVAVGFVDGLGVLGAAQPADAVAETMAASAGAEVDAQPFRPSYAGFS